MNYQNLGKRIQVVWVSYQRVNGEKKEIRKEWRNTYLMKLDRHDLKLIATNWEIRTMYEEIEDGKV